MSLWQRLITAVIVVPALCSIASAASTTGHGHLPENRPAGLAAQALPHIRAGAAGAIGGALGSAGQRASNAPPAGATASASAAHAVVIEPMPGPVYLLGVSLIGFGLVARRRSQADMTLNRV